MTISQPAWLMYRSEERKPILGFSTRQRKARKKISADAHSGNNGAGRDAVNDHLAAGLVDVQIGRTQADPRFFHPAAESPEKNKRRRALRKQRCRARRCK